MIDVTAYLPGRIKRNSSGWINFDAPCCIHNGTSADHRKRGGLKVQESDWIYHCFNCGFSTSFTLGRTLTVRARRVLGWLNVPAEEIERMNLESLQHRGALGILDDRRNMMQQLSNIRFDEHYLPNPTQPLAEEAATYLTRRAIPLDYPFLSTGIGRPGIIVPFTHDQTVVGHSVRFLDSRMPKYIQRTQPGYVFGTDLQRDAWHTAIVVEGVFDALSIDGLAVLHAEINDAQVRLIRSLERDVIVVPDQDLAGMSLVDRAVELNWAVSMPEWPAGIKDVNDAVICMGRVATLLTIMQSKETSKIKIELRKKQLVKHFKLH